MDLHSTKKKKTNQNEYIKLFQIKIEPFDEDDNVNVLVPFIGDQTTTISTACKFQLTEKYRLILKCISRVCLFTISFLSTMLDAARLCDRLKKATIKRETASYTYGLGRMNELRY